MRCIMIMVNRKNELLWEVLYEGKEVGFLMLQRIDLITMGGFGEGYIVKEVNIAENHRRQGCATRLYQALFEYVKANDLRLFRGAHLDVVDKIYNKLGATFKQSNLMSNSIREEVVLR